jgi:hypothetical protein
MPAPAPRPVQKKEPEEKKPGIEDSVREAIECIDSGHDSNVEWSLINRVYKDLCKLKKPSPRAENLKKMIEPVLSKYGYHKVSTTK